MGEYGNKQKLFPGGTATLGRSVVDPRNLPICHMGYHAKMVALHQMLCEYITLEGEKLARGRWLGYDLV